MANPQFVDVSVFNPSDIDWHAYRAWSASVDGIARVAMRSSYGVGYTDQHFQAYRAGALSAGIDQIFYYHFAYPNLNGAVAEANSQHSVVGSVRPQDVLILDFEENVPEATAQWAFTWLAAQEANYGGKLPAIYASDAYIRERLQDNRLARFPLWLANWQFTPDEHPSCPAPWSKYDYLQYSDRAANIPGIAGNVDADVFLGVGGVRDMPLSIQDPFASQYFEERSPTSWHCKTTNIDLHDAILAYYRQTGGAFRLPRTNEIYGVIPGCSFQVFEAGVLVYDPNNKFDHPGYGPVYAAHLDANNPCLQSLMHLAGVSVPAQPPQMDLGAAASTLHTLIDAAASIQAGAKAVLTDLGKS